MTLTFVACGPFAPSPELVLDLRALGQRAEPVAGDRREMDERVLPPVIGSDEAEALLVAEPLHDTSRHLTALLVRSSLPTRASCTSRRGGCQPSSGGAPACRRVPGVALRLASRTPRDRRPCRRSCRRRLRRCRRVVLGSACRRPAGVRRAWCRPAAAAGRPVCPVARRSSSSSSAALTRVVARNGWLWNGSVGLSHSPQPLPRRPSSCSRPRSAPGTCRRRCWSRSTCRSSRSSPSPGSRPTPRSTYFGVKPTNQASMFLSVVPVLPPWAGSRDLGLPAGAAGDVRREDLDGLVGHAVLEGLGALDAPALRAA